ncbi:hypothetical protein K7432_011855 [Basidiobolus ranarum]|uniref:RING-type E3 ubiquitin transferase n=1 Tax=Basidiobolus ranarum TaxID=34480 RepID=A0ABR2VT75_9FUNG
MKSRHLDLAVVLSGLFGLSSLIYGYLKYGRKAIRIQQTPFLGSKEDLMEALEILQNGWLKGGYFKIKGIAETKKPITAGLSGHDSVYTKIRYLRMVKCKSRAIWNSKSILKQEFYDEISQTPWLCRLSDGTAVTVIGKGAEYILEKTITETYTQESILRANKPVLILGYLHSPRPGIFQISKPYIRWFLISGNDETTLVKQFKFWWHVWNVIGTGLLLSSCGLHFLRWDREIFKQQAILASDQMFDEWINDKQFR